MTRVELTREYGHLTIDGEILIYRYPAGDIDTVDGTDPKKLIGALYDEHQCHEPHWPNGTQFVLDGVICAEVVDHIHVVGLGIFAHA